MQPRDINYVLLIKETEFYWISITINQEKQWHWLAPLRSLPSCSPSPSRKSQHGLHNPQLITNFFLLVCTFSACYVSGSLTITVYSDSNCSQSETTIYKDINTCINPTGPSYMYTCSNGMWTLTKYLFPNCAVLNSTLTLSLNKCIESSNSFFIYTCAASNIVGGIFPLAFVALINYVLVNWQ